MGQRPRRRPDDDLGHRVGQDLDAMTGAVLADARFRFGMKVLIDHTRTRWASMGPEDVRRRADLLARDADRIGPQLIAFVVGGPADFGVGRMLQAFLYDKTGIESRIFQSVDDARQWLAETGLEPDEPTVA